LAYKDMYKVGLTGGIGCGKSTVSNLFKQHNVPIIDADEIAHSLVSIGKPALELINKSFKGCLTSEGALNRSKLRDLIFGNPEKKQQLEKIMHPLIYAEIEKKIQSLQADYCIIAIPLLIETNMQSLVNHILVIDCTREQQIKRVKARDGLDTQKITTIINSQTTQQNRLAQADSVIHNTENKSALINQVNTLHQSFKYRVT